MCSSDLWMKTMNRININRLSSESMHELDY